MKPLLRASDVKEIDAFNAQSGMPESVLMQNFARGIADELLVRFPQATRYAVLAGPGNNGGDGIALARMLRAEGKSVWVIAPLGVKTPTAQIYQNAWQKEGCALLDDAPETLLETVDVIVDGLFGIGLTRAVDGVCKKLIQRANVTKAKRVAIDVPSGLDDWGRVQGIAFCADLTVTACGYKYALLFGEGRAYAGTVVVKDILALYPEKDYPTYVDAVSLPSRPKVCHKGSFADVWVFGGSKEYVGAGVLAHEAAVAALRSGAGLVRLCVADTDYAIFASRVKEAMLVTYPSQDGRLVCDERRLDATVPDGATVVLGMGLGKNPEVAKLTSYFLRKRKVTLIIDADGINTFTDFEALHQTKCNVLFTPHVKEFSRLCGKSVDEILRDPIASAQEFAKRNHCALLLKSDFGIATDGEATYVSACGSPSQAKGGSGDVLAGVVGAFSGVMPLLSAAIQAFVACGLAAKQCATRMGEQGVLASDVIAEICASMAQ